MMFLNCKHKLVFSFRQSNILIILVCLAGFLLVLERLSTESKFEMLLCPRHPCFGQRAIGGLICDTVTVSYGTMMRGYRYKTKTGPLSNSCLWTIDSMVDYGMRSSHHEM